MACPNTLLTHDFWRANKVLQRKRRLGNIARYQSRGRAHSNRAVLNHTRQLFARTHSSALPTLFCVSAYTHVLYALNGNRERAASSRNVCVRQKTKCPARVDEPTFVKCLVCFFVVCNFGETWEQGERGVSEHAREEKDKRKKKR